MLVLVEVRDVYTEERVRNPGRRCRVGKVDVDEESCEQAENWIPAPCAAAPVGIQRPDDAILVFVPVNNVLLHNLWIVLGMLLDVNAEDETYCLVLVVLSPVVLRGSVGALVGSRNVCPGGSRILETVTIFWVVRQTFDSDGYFFDGNAVLFARRKIANLVLE